MSHHPISRLAVVTLLAALLVSCSAQPGRSSGGVAPVVIEPDPRMVVAEATPVPLPVRLYSVNSLTLACHGEPDLAAPVLAQHPPGTVQALDQYLRTASGVWHHDGERDCWVRTTPGPVELFGDRAAVQRRAERFPLHALAGTQTATSEQAACPEGCKRRVPGCDIKASATSGTYRLPDDRDYTHYVVIPSRGDRWFCTEDEAVATGWHRSSR
jgi:hypothetical protein